MSHRHELQFGVKAVNTHIQYQTAATRQTGSHHVVLAEVCTQPGQSLRLPETHHHFPQTLTNAAPAVAMRNVHQNDALAVENSAMRNSDHDRRGPEGGKVAVGFEIKLADVDGQFIVR